MASLAALPNIGSETDHACHLTAIVKPIRCDQFRLEHDRCNEANTRNCPKNTDRILVSLLACEFANFLLNPGNLLFGSMVFIDKHVEAESQLRTEVYFLELSNRRFRPIGEAKRLHDSELQKKALDLLLHRP